MFGLLTFTTSVSRVLLVAEPIVWTVSDAVLSVVPTSLSFGTITLLADPHNFSASELLLLGVNFLLSTDSQNLLTLDFPPVDYWLRFSDS